GGESGAGAVEKMEPFTLEVHPLEKVISLKRRVTERLGLPPGVGVGGGPAVNHTRLILMGKSLQAEDITCLQAGVEDGSDIMAMSMQRPVINNNN
ncbi:unnamed protein product, partial [Discosporangium mesarthrocarpum]